MKIITVKSDQRDQFFVLCSDGLLAAVDMNEAQEIHNGPVEYETWNLKEIKN